MLDDDLPLAEALGPGRTDIVVLEDFHERGAREAGHDRRHPRAEGDRRQDVVFPRVRAHGGQPAEAHGKNLHEQQAQREGGEGNARNRKGHPRVILPFVAPRGRNHADDEAEEDRPDHAPDRQPEGRRETLPDFVAHRPLGADRGAEIPFRQDFAEIGDELFRYGFIQPEVLADQFHRGLIGLGPGREARRIAGEHVNEEKDQHRDQKKRGNQPEEPFDEIMEHPRNLMGRGAGKAPPLRISSVRSVQRSSCRQA